MRRRIEFRYRPAFVREVTTSAGHGAILAAAITYFAYPSDSVLLGALGGALGGGGLTLILDLNTRRRARRLRAETDAAYRVALKETSARVQDKAPDSPGTPKG